MQNVVSLMYFLRWFEILLLVDLTTVSFSFFVHLERFDASQGTNFLIIFTPCTQPRH